MPDQATAWLCIGGGCTPQTIITSLRNRVIGMASSEPGPAKLYNACTCIQYRSPLLAVWLGSMASCCTSAFDSLHSLHSFVL